MKTFIALAVTCLIASCLASPLQLSDEQKAKVHFQECIKQENVSESDAARLRNKDFTNPSDNNKCFATCYLEKTGTLKDSQVQEEVVFQILGPKIGDEHTKEVLGLCQDIKGCDRCDTGFKMYECYETYKAKLAA